MLQLLRDSPAGFDIVLLDISMPDKNGMEILKRIVQEFPDVAVNMLTMHAEDEFGVRALKGGAAGYISKQSAPAELVNAIRQVSACRRYISPRLAKDTHACVPLPMITWS